MNEEDRVYESLMALIGEGLTALQRGDDKGAIAALDCALAEADRYAAKNPAVIYLPDRTKESWT